MNNKFLLTLKVLVSLLLMGLILIRIDLNSTWQLLLQSSPLLFIYSLVMLAIQSLIAAVRWRYVLGNMKIRITFSNSVCYLWIGLFFNQILPSSVGGDIIKGYYLKAQGITLGSATLGVLLDRLFGMTGLVILVIITLPLLFYRIDDTIVLAGMIMVATVTVGIIVSILALDILPVYLLRWRLVRGLFALSHEGRKQMLTFSPGAKLVTVSVVIHLMSIIVVLILARGMKINADWIGIFLVIPVATLAMAIPISIAGWGVREGVLVVGLGYFGFTSDVALALSVLYGLAVMIVALPGGIVWLISGRFIRKEQLIEVQREMNTLK